VVGTTHGTILTLHMTADATMLLFSGVGGFMLTAGVATRQADSAATVQLLLRTATPGDLDALLALAEAGGTGLTNLPPNRKALGARLEASAAAVNDPAVRDAGAGIIFVIADQDGAIVATSAVFARIGIEWPFYSYRLIRQAGDSRTAERRTHQTLLVTTNDFDGEAEVGGLFVAPAARALSVGKLAARSRYLFMAQHRDWFGNRVIAELRGWQNAAGLSPVWESIGKHFYNMTLAQADRFGSVRGNQFIADLGPRYPIYTSLLPPEAGEALGRPHDEGQGAYAMLLKEGFVDQGYVDIFDGGPTPVADIDRLATVRSSRTGRFAGLSAAPRTDALVAAGEGERFRVLRTLVDGEGEELRLSEPALRLLDLDSGESLRWCPVTVEAA
jgi:arginine N-succinyltransferase